MRDKTRATLSIFVEKARKLQSLSFPKFVATEGLGIAISGGMNQDLKIVGRLPDTEAVDAFLLTFRFFIQRNEDTSFRSLHENALGDPGLSDGWKHEFEAIRSGLNRYLDGHPGIGITLNGVSINRRREVLMNFLYGELAHANEEKRQVVETWKSDPITYALVQLVFPTF